MAVYQVVTVPNPVLKQVALPVEKINAGVIRALDNMSDTMYATDGIGLAAPQIGISKRMIVVDVGEGLIELVNPEITFKDGEEIGTEGCLSVPGVVAWVNRAKSIRVHGLNRDGERVEYEASDIFARCLQHEIDHLHGVLITDKATEVKRDDN
ncbi:MAG: peptide deformylase [Bacillota bacterium]|nr:peptide deformylase [Bacillota bacterium]